MSVPPSTSPVPQTPDEAACLRVVREQPLRWYGWRGSLAAGVVAAGAAYLVWHLLGWGPEGVASAASFLGMYLVLDAARSVLAQRSARRTDRLVPLRVCSVLPRRGGAGVVASEPGGREVRWDVVDAHGITPGDTVWAACPRRGRPLLAAAVDAGGHAVALRPRNDSTTITAMPDPARAARSA